MKRLVYIILLLFVSSMTFGQEIKQIASWSNSKTTDLGNGQKRFEMTLARSWIAEKVYNANGDIIAIRNISGQDTVSHIYSNFSELIAEERNGNLFTKIKVQKGKTATLTILKGDIEIKDDEIITNMMTAKQDTIKKHIRISSKGRDVMKVVDLKGIDDKGKFVKLEKIEKIDNKVIATFQDSVNYYDPTWSWQPDATAGIDNMMHYGQTTNYGDNVEMDMGMYSSNPLRILIKFSVLGDSIPSNANITSGKIVFTKQVNKFGTPATTVHAFILKRNWDEMTSTATIYSTGNNWAAVGAYHADDIYMSDSTVTTTGVDWLEIDSVQIGTCLNKIVGINAVYTNYGFLLKLSSEVNNNVGYWTSSDSATASSRPKIFVNYTLSTMSGVLTLTPLSNISIKCNIDTAVLMPDSLKVYKVTSGVYKQYSPKFTDTTYTLDTLTYNTSYIFRVKMYKIGVTVGDSVWTNLDTATTYYNPVILTATPIDTNKISFILDTTGITSANFDSFKIIKSNATISYTNYTQTVFTDTLDTLSINRLYDIKAIVLKNNLTATYSNVESVYTDPQPANALSLSFDTDSSFTIKINPKNNPVHTLYSLFDSIRVVKDCTGVYLYYDSLKFLPNPKKMTYSALGGASGKKFTLNSIHLSGGDTLWIFPQTWAGDSTAQGLK